MNNKTKEEIIIMIIQGLELLIEALETARNIYHVERIDEETKEN